MVSVTLAVTQCFVRSPASRLITLLDHVMRPLIIKRHLKARIFRQRKMFS